MDSAKATITATILMIVFFFAGDVLLRIIGLDVPSFAIA
ncbi:MarC family protein, partial [Corynebacterium sp.]